MIHIKVYKLSNVAMLRCDGCGAELPDEAGGIRGLCAYLDIEKQERPTPEHESALRELAQNAGWAFIAGDGKLAAIDYCPECFDLS